MDNYENDTQKRIRKRITEIHADNTISSSDKHRLIMEAMSMISIVPMMSAPKKCEDIASKNTEIKEIKIEEREAQQKSMIIIETDCNHYQRGCLVQCPDEQCKKFTKCRLCHDSKINDHQLDRFSIAIVLCSNCKEIQPIHNKCSKCDHIFGKYYCDICHLFENNVEKNLRGLDCLGYNF